MKLLKKMIKNLLRLNNVFKVKRPYITYALLVINAIIFFLVHWNPQLLNNLVLLKNINSEYYRIITAAFTHYDIFHLLFNMYAYM